MLDLAFFARVFICVGLPNTTDTINQSSNFLEGSFSNRDDARTPIQFRRLFRIFRVTKFFPEREEKDTFVLFHYLSQCFIFSDIHLLV